MSRAQNALVDLFPKIYYDWTNGQWVWDWWWLCVWTCPIVMCSCISVLQGCTPDLVLMKSILQKVDVTCTVFNIEPISLTVWGHPSVNFFVSLWLEVCGSQFWLIEQSHPYGLLLWLSKRWKNVEAFSDSHYSDKESSRHKSKYKLEACWTEYKHDLIFAK